MADYFTPTTVEPEIPDGDMTALERLLLSNIFETERYHGKTYLFSSEGPSDMSYVARSELAAALAASETIASATNNFIKEQLAANKDDAGDIELDMSVTGWTFVFQDIIRRSATIPYMIVKSAFTCTKMRPDGFGGMVTLITADDVMAKSTYDLIEEFEAKVTGDATNRGAQQNTSDGAS